MPVAVGYRGIMVVVAAAVSQVSDGVRSASFSSSPNPGPDVRDGFTKKSSPG